MKDISKKTMQIIKDKRGASLDDGMKTIMKFFGGIAILVVLGFIILVLAGALGDAAEDSLEDLTITLNETVADVSETAVGTSYEGLRKCSLVITEISLLNGTVISADNYTTLDCKLQYIGGVDAHEWNDTDWNVTGVGSYERNTVIGMSNNVTTGVGGFFSNASTWFTILSVVIIIGAVVVILQFVRGKKGEQLG